LSSLVIGNVRDVEVKISGKEGNYDLVLRTGAWGKDIVIPTTYSGFLTVGAAVLQSYTVSSYRDTFI
jgi:hypothetical protein